VNSNDAVSDAFVALGTSERKDISRLYMRHTETLHPTVSNFYTFGLQSNEFGRDLFQSGLPDFPDYPRVEEWFS
jgi:hypothetical protein